MKVLVTGHNGFIGKNLLFKLNESGFFDISTFGKSDTLAQLKKKISKVDAIVHLAGENRPTDDKLFFDTNVKLTTEICKLISCEAREIQLIFLSSAQVILTNKYGESKRAAEDIICNLHYKTLTPVVIYRPPGVFGKWCKPNYNSVVATFCHQIANDKSVNIIDPEKELRLVYIDDLVSDIIEQLKTPYAGLVFKKIEPEYSVKVKELKELIESFYTDRIKLKINDVGNGFQRALYSTFISYLPDSKFAYQIPTYSDSRGEFVEVLKTQNCGQISYLIARPGVTRGNHYHHTKSEFFLVIAGNARFRFSNLISGQSFEIFTSADQPTIVQSIPGWAHNITNVGANDLISIVWANEIFNKTHPDTFPHEIN